MKKYLLLAFVSLLFPAIASAITPKLGHYEGTATIFGGGVERKISFDVTRRGEVNVELKHFHLPPNIFKEGDRHFGSTQYGEIFCSFFIFDVAAIKFVGHCIWEKDGFCAGDFREYAAFAHGGTGENVYYTWHAHWKHQ